MLCAEGCYHRHCIFTCTSPERSRQERLCYKSRMCSEQGWVCDGSHSPLSPGLARSRVWEMELGVVQCLCSLKQRRQTCWANWERGKAPPHPKHQTQRTVEGGEGLGISFFAQVSWGEEGVPHQATPHCLSPPLHLPSPSEAPAEEASLPLVFYRCGEVSIPWRIWTVPADFPLERGLSPFVFQSGLRTCSAGCQLDGRHSGPLPYSLSVSSLLFPSPLLPPTFSASSLLPLSGGKADQIFQVYWKENRTGVGSSRAASSKCFSTVLHSVETPLQGNGVSNQLRHSPALNGGIPAAINKLTLLSPTVESLLSAGLRLGVW